MTRLVSQKGNAQSTFQIIYLLTKQNAGSTQRYIQIKPGHKLVGGKSLSSQCETEHVPSPDDPALLCSV